jgi:hypothetical protein
MSTHHLDGSCPSRQHKINLSQEMIAQCMLYKSDHKNLRDALQKSKWACQYVIEKHHKEHKEETY